MKRVCAFWLVFMFCALLLTSCAWWQDLFGQADQVHEEISRKASDYLDTQYPDNDFVIGEPQQHLKGGSYYYVDVRSPSSQDTYFSLQYDDKTYKLITDGYQQDVASGWNTRVRLVDAYSALVDDCLTSITSLQRIDSDFCKYSTNTTVDHYFSPEGLDPQTLTLDKEYNAGKLGADYGFLEITAVITNDPVDFQDMLNVWQQIDRQLTDQGVGYCLLELSIVDNDPETDTLLKVYNIRPEGLQQDDPIRYLQDLWDVQEAHRQNVKEQYRNG